MKSLLSAAFAMLLVGFGTHALTAQSLPRPGLLAPVSNARLEPSSSSSINPTAINPTAIDVQEQRHDRIVNRVWIGSLVGVLAATGMDAATSLGKDEGNAFLASNGRFGAKGISIKAGLAAGTVITEVLSRKHKDMRTKFAIFNFGEAALFSAVAVHNLGVAPPK
jgi:hypothetical protein